jgi:hypothetical protein
MAASAGRDPAAPSNSWRRATSIAVAVLLVLAVGLLWRFTVQGASTEPVAVVMALTEARNAKDLDAVLAIYADDAHVLGHDLDWASRREAFEDVLLTQFAMDWQVESFDCEDTGEQVVCAYRMHDTFHRALGLHFEGRHRYEVVDGRITRHDRHHQSGGREIEAAVSEFHAWVDEHHPSLVPVIWSHPTAMLATTPEGAAAIASILDDWLDQRVP